MTSVIEQGMKVTIAKGPETRAGRGKKSGISLPVERKQKMNGMGNAVAVQQEQEGLNRMNKRILVIDDDQAVRESLTRAFEVAGCPVDTAESGEKGLEAVQAREYELIFLKKPVSADQVVLFATGILEG